jgi:hypothetical protein
MVIEKIEAILTPLSNADGSCELKSNLNLVLCGVIGPGDVSSSKRLFDRSNIFVTINRISQKSKEGIYVILLIFLCLLFKNWHLLSALLFQKQIHHPLPQLILLIDLFSQLLKHQLMSVLIHELVYKSALRN